MEQEDAHNPREIGGRGLSQRWAHGCWRWRWPILVVWGVIAVVGGLQFATLDHRLHLPEFSITGSESARNADRMAEAFPRIGSEQSAVVITAPDRATVESAARAVGDTIGPLSGVREVITPATPLVGTGLVAPDGRTALVVVALDGDVPARDASTTAIGTALRELDLPTGAQTFLTGETPMNKALAEVEQADQKRSEAIGLSLAVVLLLFGTRSVVAAGITVATAALGVALASIGIAVASTLLPVTQFALVIATALGLGVGIDYALFVVSRFREELTAGPEPPDGRVSQTAVVSALGCALRTSGHTVIVSGVIVMVSMCSIVIIDGPVFRDIATAAGFVVLCTMLTAVTALPAALAVVATRLGRSRQSANRGTDHGLWYRWVHMVQRHPAAFGIPAASVLIALSLPAFGTELGLDLGLNTLGRTEAGHGYLAAEATFGGAVVAPMSVTACAVGSELTDADLSEIRAFEQRAAARGDVHSVSSVFDLMPGTSPTLVDLHNLAPTPIGAAVSGALVDDLTRPRCLLVTVESASRVDSPATAALVTDLRSDAATASDSVQIEVGGMAAQYHDLSRETATKFPIVIGLVVAASVLYLMMTLRSVLVPIKAVLLNLLATAATIGATVAVFQFGYGERVFDFTSVGTIQAFLPVALFAVLFGLSMDYEVFMVRRIREEYDRCGDTAEAVRTAMQRVAPQITIAGSIMIAVFGSLVVADVLELKQIGFGLAVAVFLDITLVRLILVPVLMSLADRYNWWFPEPRLFRRSR